MRSIIRSVPLLLGILLAVAVAPPAWSAPSGIQANCNAFTVVGDPRTTNGANWTYRSTDAGLTYALEGVLFAPAGTGPFPAAVVSHGKGGTPRGYSARMARIMVGWGMVAIAPMYTHAPDAEDQGNLPDGPDGASAANVQRTRKARELLACVGGVDLTRVAAHGNSLRALCMHLDSLDEEAVTQLNIPTGIPLVYSLDENLEVTGSRYLGDAEAAAKAAAAVASETSQ